MLLSSVFYVDTNKALNIYNESVFSSDHLYKVNGAHIEILIYAPPVISNENINGDVLLYIKKTIKK